MNAPRSPNDLLSLGILSACINIVLMLVKIGVGLLGNSYALVADGIESAADIFSSLITWAGFQISLKPADEDHPYGHGKIESLAGMFSGFSLLAAAGIIGYHSILEIRTPHHAPAWFTLPVLILVVIVKEFLSRRVLSASEAVDSTALKGDAWHHRSDAITSGAAATGIAIALIGGNGFEAADDWAALAACGIILVNGVLILKGALHDVLDGSVPKDISSHVSDLAASVSGVENIEKCRVRKSGIRLFVELHVRVDPQISVFEGHKIGHDVKNHLLSADPRIQDVIVHVEPASADVSEGNVPSTQIG
ncbi:MAG TPA: cation diffusion facilitator family transporter [Chthoniobacterales bacterium]